MLGEFLRIARIANDKKIIDVAEETGISKSYLTEIEKGIKKPSDDILQKICTNYNIVSTYLQILIYSHLRFIKFIKEHFKSIFSKTYF